MDKKGQPLAKGALGPKLVAGDLTGGGGRIAFTVSKLREGARGPSVAMPAGVPTTDGPSSAVPPAATQSSPKK